MGHEQDAQQLSKAGTWWERARVTVLGISILITIITTAYFAGSVQAEIVGKLDSTARIVAEIRDTSKIQGETIHQIAERLSRLETAKESQDNNIRMFWAFEADLKGRVERIEQLILGKPTMREKIR